MNEHWRPVIGLEDRYQVSNLGRVRNAAGTILPKPGATMNYEDFLAGKIDVSEETGMDPDGLTLSPGLFPHQQDAVRWALRRGRGLIAMSFGLGKCHGAGTPILMADGSIKPVEDVRVGDRLMGNDSTPRTVMSLARGREAMYRVTLRNGDSYTCNESHVMSLTVSNRYHGLRPGSIVNMTVREWLALPEYAKRNCFKHYKVGVEFPAQPVDFDPYLYGAWLGDGSSRELAYTINDRDTEIVERIYAYAEAEGMAVTVRPERGCTGYRIRRRTRGRSPHCAGYAVVKASMTADGKRIAPAYLRNSRAVRLHVLAGLLDTDGHLIAGCYEIVTKWAGLREDILYLCRSLGFSVSHGEKVVNGVTYWRIYISGDMHLIPCVTRKRAGMRRQTKRPLVYGFDVEPLGVGDYYGFELDGNHLYLLGDFTVTHNTRIQVEIAKQLHVATGGRFLIVCPLGVKHQFVEEDGPAMGVRWVYVRTDAELEAADSPFVITNYERVRDGNIDPRKHDLAGVSLDEGSVLRSLGSKTYHVFETVFANVPFRYVCTATPSPNRFRELIYYAQFLGIMDAGQALTRWFKRDPQQAGNLTLHPHHEKDFWLWVASWALFLYRPSDLGYDDSGYEVPQLVVHWRRIGVDHQRAFAQTDNRGQHKLLLDAAGSALDAVREKRATLAQRVAEMVRVLEENPGRHWILWHHLEDERRAITAAVPEATAVYGSQELEEREQRILDFSHGRLPILASKPELTGSGCNFQYHCHSAVYLGIDYKFEDFIQSIHRLHRFQQKQAVEIWIIYSESEDHVVEVLKQKWARHEELTKTMQGIVRRYGLSHAALKGELKRSIGVSRSVVSGRLYTVVHNDCVAELPNVEADSVGLIHTSVPFGNHYQYTIRKEDFGFNPSDADFWEQMDFLIPHLWRVLKPGRVAAIHVKDRILYGHQTDSGFMEVSPFSDECVAAFRKHGFLYEGRRTIVTDVVRENASTYRLGWSEMTRDTSKMGSGLPEYLLCLRKPPTDAKTAYADEPVTKEKASYSRARWQVDAHSFWRSNGNAIVAPGARDIYDHEAHIARLEDLERGGALPASFFLEPPVSHSDAVWDDVVYMRTLNSNQSQKRRENHICPLPLDIVERTLRLYSNEGDLVLDPFSGLGTVGYVALGMGRRYYGVELNDEYFRWSVKYLQEKEMEVAAPTLFDMLGLPPEKG